MLIFRNKNVELNIDSLHQAATKPQCDPFKKTKKSKVRLIPSKEAQ